MGRPEVRIIKCNIFHKFMLSCRKFVHILHTTQKEKGYPPCKDTVLSINTNYSKPVNFGY